jgi:hypothetical protein
MRLVIITFLAAEFRLYAMVTPLNMQSFEFRRQFQALLIRQLGVVCVGFAWLSMPRCTTAQPNGQPAAGYVLRVGSETGRKLELRAEPILHWTNPVPEKQMQGEVFLWTDDGRPAAVLNWFEMSEDGALQTFHEFTSLAEEGLLGTGPANRRWTPGASAVKISALNGAPMPAITPWQRLSQMRALATQFVCEKTDRKGQTQTLRLLSQPIARYESTKHHVIDGGLFTFVEATDPEAFLLLEVKPVGDRLQWHFGMARMASVKIQASFHDNVVWQVKTLPFEDYRNRADQPYALLPAR